jgi:hypothetical protein
VPKDWPGLPLSGLETLLLSSATKRSVASLRLLVQEARRRKIGYLVVNAGLCQNPVFGTTGLPKDRLAAFGTCIFQSLKSSCSPTASLLSQSVKNNGFGRS